MQTRCRMDTNMVELPTSRTSTQTQCRRSIRSGILSFVVSALLLSAGCAHEQAYKRGEKLSREGQYDRAVQELETAVRLAEEHKKYKAATQYQQKLDEVKRQAGQFYYHEAEMRFKWAELSTAQSLVEKAITYCPQEQTYRAFRERVLQAVTQAEQIRDEALALAEQQQWQTATQRMNEALALYRTMPGGDANLKHIRERAYGYYLDRAQGKLSEGDLQNAEAEAQAALLYEATGKEAKAVIQAVKDRREAAGLIAHGRALLEQGQAEAALQELERAAKLYPSHTELPDLIGQARRAVCDGWLAQGRRAMQSGNYVAAIRLFEKSRDLLRDYGGAAALLADARAQLGENHLKASRQHLQEGADGVGVLHAAAALGYLPDSLEAKRQLSQCADRVRQEVDYAIAFIGFQAAPEHQNLAAAFAAATLEHLTRTRPANVTVIERFDLQTSLGQELVTSGTTGAVRREANRELNGLDAILVGQILEGDVVVESKRSGQGESTYQDGYRPEPNPDYVHAARELDKAIAELEHARTRLAEAEARLARYRNTDPADAEEMARKRKAQADVDEAKQRLVNAASDVTTARIRLGAIPPEVLVPNMVKYQYPIQTFTKTAKVNGMIKLLDTATGELITAERLEGRYEESDRVVSGDPQRNVPDDPLALSDDDTTLERASDPAITRLRQVLSQACEKHGHRFAVEMHRAESAGDTIRAVDNSIKYLFAYPAGNEQTAYMIDYLRKYLGDESSLIDIRQLLRTHCHVLTNR